MIGKDTRISPEPEFRQSVLQTGQPPAPKDSSYTVGRAPWQTQHLTKVALSESVPSPSGKHGVTNPDIQIPQHETPERDLSEFQEAQLLWLSKNDLLT